MGACESICGKQEEADLPTPGSQATTVWLKKAGVFDGSFLILTDDDPKKAWMDLKQNAGAMASHHEFLLANRMEKENVLLTSRIEKGKDVVDKSVDFQKESNGLFDTGGWSDDDIWGSTTYDDNDEVHVKLNFDCKRSAKFTDKDKNEFATLNYTAAGKALAEIDFDGSDCSVSLRVKKVAYELTYRGKKIEIEFENGKWEKWDRKWSCSLFEATFVSNWGTDEIKVVTKEGCDACEAIAVAHCLCWFLHPTGTANDMKDKAKDYAKSFTRRS